jgi:hypothetical protein
VGHGSEALVLKKIFKEPPNTVLDLSLWFLVGMFKLLVSNGCRLTCKSLTQHDHQPFVAKEKEKVCVRNLGITTMELTVLVHQVLEEFCDHALTLFHLNLSFFCFSLPYYKLSSHSGWLLHFLLIVPKQQLTLEVSVYCPLEFMTCVTDCQLADYLLSHQTWGILLWRTFVLLAQTWVLSLCSSSPPLPAFCWVLCLMKFTRVSSLSSLHAFAPLWPALGFCVSSTKP